MLSKNFCEKLFIVLFSRNHFMEGCFTFQRVGLFSNGGASFLSGGCAPWGGIGFDGGGGFSRKIGGWEGAPPLWETLITIGVFIVSLSASTFHTLF